MMKGEHRVIVRNNRVQIKLDIRRNLTILQGNSATGKTTLIDLIAEYDRFGDSSGIVINCDVPCKVLAGRYWQRDLSEIQESIVFIDEDNAFMKTKDLYLAYSKSKLNSAYLEPRAQNLICDQLPDLGI